MATRNTNSQAASGGAGQTATTPAITPTKRKARVPKVLTPLAAAAKAQFVEAKMLGDFVEAIANTSAWGLEQIEKAVAQRRVDLQPPGTPEAQ